MRRRRAPAALLALAALLAPASGAAAPGGRAPCAEHDPLRRPHFGDTHVHTTFSFDAWGQGTRNTPRDASRFARGEPLGIQPYDADEEPLRTVRLRRPLDFAVVTDHSEMLGETHICRTPGTPGHDSLVCTIMRRWPKLGYMIFNSQIHDVRDPERYGFCGEEGRHCIETAAIPWREIQRAAEEAQDRSAACRFTSFVGYEWSGNPDSSMIHRNVVFRNATVPRLPATYVETPTGEALWRKLRADCLEGLPGCEVLVIPHNSNLSNGLTTSRIRAKGSVSKPQSSSAEGPPARHSESPLCCVTSTSTSSLLRSSASSRESAPPDALSVRKSRPLLRFELCGIASTSQPGSPSRQSSRSLRHSASPVGVSM